MGRVIELFCRRPFDFADLAAGEAQTVVIERAVDVCAYGDAVLQVKVHGLDIGADATLEVLLFTISPTWEDPDQDFLSVEPVAVAEIDATTQAGTLVVAGLADPFGGFLQVQVRATQPGAATDLQAEISAELVVRSGVAPKPQTQGNFGLDSASPTLTVGDGTGSPVAALDKLATGSAAIELRDAGVARWKLVLDASENLDVERYNSGGVLQGTLVMSGGNGDLTLPASLALSSSSPGIVIGDGGGTTSLTLNKAGASTARVEFQNTGTTKWDIIEDSSENLLVRQGGSSTSLKFFTSDGAVRGKLLWMHVHSCDMPANTTPQYIPWAIRTENSTVATIDTYFVAPYDGRLIKVLIKNASTGQTANAACTLHADSGAVTTTVRETGSGAAVLSQDTTRTYTFGSFAISGGDSVAVRITLGTAATAALEITTVWEWDQNT